MEEGNTENVKMLGLAFNAVVCIISAT